MEMGENPASSLDAGIKLFNEGNMQAAISSLQEVVQADPTNTKAHSYLGAAFGQIGNNESAINEFVQLTRLEPRNPAHYFNLGRTYESNGAKDQAISAYQQSLVIKPDYDKARQALSRIAPQLATPVQPNPVTAPAPQVPRSTPAPAVAPKTEPGPLPQAPWQTNAPQTNQAPPAYGQSAYPGQYQPYGSRQYDPNNMPDELRGLNWGAFLMSLWWSIGNQVWIGLLILVPYIGWIMSFVLLVKGNEWAWKSRQFDSVEHFRKVQKVWLIWGLALTVLNLILLPALLFPVFMRAREAARATAYQQQHSAPYQQPMQRPTYR